MNEVTDLENRLNEINEQKAEIREKLGYKDLAGISKKQLKEKLAELQLEELHIKSGAGISAAEEKPDKPKAEFYFGACRFCGQVGNTDIAYLTQEEANDAATDNCKCDEACAERRIRRQIQSAASNIRDIFGAGAEEHGFQEITEPEIFRLLENVIELTARRKLASSVIQIRGYCRAAIAYTPKGEIKIARTESKAYQIAE